MGARRGEYILLAKNQLVNSTLFFTPTAKGKGVLVTQTVDGNIMLGPTSEECEGNVPTTSASGLDYIISKAKQMCDNIPFYDTITAFAGVRAYCDRHDFVIEQSKVDNRFGFHLTSVYGMKNKAFFAFIYCANLKISIKSCAVIHSVAY